MNQQEIQGLFIKGDRALKIGNYVQAITFFETLLQKTDPNSSNYFHIQRGLAKAYYQNQAIDKAIALCTEIITSSSSGNKLWGEQFLATITKSKQAPSFQGGVPLTGEPIAENILDSPAESEPKKNYSHKHIKPKSLAEFKNYCRTNLLPQLKELEKQRIRALISIIVSGIICIILSGAISFWLTSFLIFQGLFYFSFFLILVCLFPLWLIYCRSCIHVYGLGFKRKIIEKIVAFIDDNHGLEYASHLLLLDKYHTELCFGRSQLFSKSTEVPDFLKQEDCVYGNLGGTDIFFAEILVEKSSNPRDSFTANLRELSPRLGSNNLLIKNSLQTLSLILNTIIYLIVVLIKLNRLGLVADNKKNTPEITYKTPKTKIFRGLFFIAKFPKSFAKRTFILPNKFSNKITPQSWRGKRINLEDSEFNRLFSVYGDSQLESRYILSTNLMDRLVQFQKKARRNIYISFIEGHVCIAIRYYHNLFEPKLFTSMLSFAPLREYFENLQLIMGIVQDLNLNQKIWQPKNNA